LSKDGTLQAVSVGQLLNRRGLYASFCFTLKRVLLFESASCVLCLTSTAENIATTVMFNHWLRFPRDTVSPAKRALI